MLLFLQKNMGKIYSFLVIVLVVLFFPYIAQAATLSINPSTGNFEAGQSVSVKVFASSAGVPFNAVSGVVSFPTSIFSIESISKSGSILDFWVSEPYVSKSAGTVKFEGVSLGGTGKTSGTVITINLRAKNVGVGKAFFQSGQILANDGEGTDITGALNGANYSVVESTKPTPAPAPTPKPKPTPPKVEPVEEPEPVQPLPTLKAPEIKLGTKYGAQAILGTSDYPKSQVLVTFMSEDGTKVYILGNADDNGEFTLVVPSSLKNGTYTTSAVMIKEDKTNSETSNAILVKVGNILSDIGWQVSTLIFILILLIIYLILRIHFHIENHSNKNVKREVNEAEDVLHKSFEALNEDLVDYDNRKTTLAEHKRIVGLKKDIADAEKVIDKKIKNIGS